MDAAQLLDEGISLAASGRLEEAVERLKEAAQLDGSSAGVYVHLGRAYAKAKMALKVDERTQKMEAPAEAMWNIASDTGWY